MMPVELLDPPDAPAASLAASTQPLPAARPTVRTKPRRTLLVIDGQNDFADPAGSLTSLGADGAMRRVADMLIRDGGKVDDLILTFDQHPRFHIGHARWFVDPDGRHPEPFTPIPHDEFVAGRWFCYSDVLQQETATYLKALEAADKQHRVWPDHCIFGTAGSNLFPPLEEATCRWETAHRKNARKFSKGENPLREHFSAIECDVPDPTDPSTQTNQFLLSLLGLAAEIGVAGLIRWPCLGETVRSIIRHRPTLASRLVLLTDGTVDGVGLESQGEQMVAEVTALGVRLATTTNWL
jgi:nicotinamidase-related amidase